jgi:SH3 domain-containing YSC84-like protein 1
MFRRYFSLAVCLGLAVATIGAQSTQKNQNKEQERLATAAVVMNEILDVPDNVPQDILDKAECIIVIPSMTKVALGVGGSYGRGAMVCRSGKAFDGSWGAPAMYAIEGGSFGLQLGAQATDVVLMVMNPRGVEALLSSKVKLGGEASAAAGPKGRHVEASTDASMRAEILSYSRSRGLFAGVSLEGTSLRPDDDATEQVYGRRISAREIITGTSVPASGRALVDVLQKRAPRNQSGTTGRSGGPRVWAHRTGPRPVRY